MKYTYISIRLFRPAAAEVTVADPKFSNSKFLFVPENQLRHRQTTTPTRTSILTIGNTYFEQQRTMPSSEYTSTTGGALKLKSKTGAGITKPKKKKKPTPKPSDEVSTEDAQSISTPDSKQRPTSRDRAKTETEQSESLDLESRQDGEQTLSLDMEKEVADTRREDSGGKTEAERRYEERRRKRLDERLRREGVKTHKERVEELNRYLSRLSEHHDMPRIGPG